MAARRFSSWSDSRSRSRWEARARPVRRLTARLPFAARSIGRPPASGTSLSASVSSTCRYGRYLDDRRGIQESVIPGGSSWAIRCFQAPARFSTRPGSRGIPHVLAAAALKVGARSRSSRAWPATITQLSVAHSAEISRSVRESYTAATPGRCWPVQCESRAGCEFRRDSEGVLGRGKSDCPGIRSPVSSTSTIDRRQTSESRSTSGTPQAVTRRLRRLARPKLNSGVPVGLSHQSANECLRLKPPSRLWSTRESSDPVSRRRRCLPPAVSMTVPASCSRNPTAA